MRINLVEVLSSQLLLSPSEHIVRQHNLKLGVELVWAFVDGARQKPNAKRVYVPSGIHLP